MSRYFWKTVACATSLCLAGAVGGCSKDEAQDEVEGEVEKTTTIQLREHLNQEYGTELVSFPFTAANKECRADSVLVTGPNGPRPAQLTEVEYHSADGIFVKSARLWILVDRLEPLAASTYTVTYGSTTAPPPFPDTDLAVTENDEAVEITTEKVGVRLPIGSGSGDAPAPMLAMRLATDEWGGGSELAEDLNVKTWSSEIAARGPAFARVMTTYELADGTAASFTATVVAGDNAVRWEMDVKADHPEQVVNFLLPPVPGAEKAVFPKGYGQWARDREQALTPSAESFCSLSPNSSLINIFAEYPSQIIVSGSEGREIQLASSDPGAWVEPGPPQTYGGQDHWHLETVGKMWELWKRKAMPVSYAADGTVRLQASLAAGRRKWIVSAGAPSVGERLDWVNAMVLDWPDKAESSHPLLLLDQADIDAVWQRAADNPDVQQQLGGSWAAKALNVLAKDPEHRADQEVKAIVDQLRNQLAQLGNYDVMRLAIRVTALYDALIDSELLTDEDRSLFRAQMAYLGYLMADPMCWSSERGFGSGNPNMHCSYILSQALIACTLRDHPMSEAWIQYGIAWMDEWLDDEVGENGNWLPEGSHYGIVSLEPQLTFAIAAKRAGYRDFTQDERLKKFILYYAKTHTPPDPQRGDFRVSGAYGRGTSGDRLGIFGVAAKMTADTDPDYAKLMQWMWKEMGYSQLIGDYRLGGYLPYYVDRQLPLEAPVWDSELFPQLGTLLRAGFDTEHESYVNVLSAVDSRRNLDIWTPGVGSVSQWYGRGVPLSTCFTFDTGYASRHELLRDGVRLARNWQPEGQKTPFGYYTETEFGAFAPLPQADYVRTRIVNTQPDSRDWFPPNVPAYPQVRAASGTDLEWTRQLFQMKSADPSGPAYLVLRDTTRGGEPTAWQFWTLSEKIGTPLETQDIDAFLADKPGANILPARQLTQSDRYTALGQFGMDVEYFVASPSETPRHTLRYGGTYRKVPEFQDLLHLQLPGDGAYYVAIYPHPRGEQPPAFDAVAGGKIMKITAAFGTDYVFLSDEAIRAEADEATFEGTAGAIQQRAEGTLLSLASAGRIEYQGFAVEAANATSLHVTPDELILSAPPQNPGGKLTVTVPQEWKAQPADEVQAEKAEGGFLVTLPAGAAKLRFRK